MKQTKKKCPHCGGVVESIEEGDMESSEKAESKAKKSLDKKTLILAFLKKKGGKKEEKKEDKK